MKTLDIIQGFCDHVFRDKKGNRIFPNIFVGKWEADLLEVTRSRLTYEYEVKVSRCDFHKDKKKSDKIEQEEARTFEQLAVEWHATNKKWSEEHSRRVLKSLEDNLFPAIGKRNIADLKTRDLLAPIKAVELSGRLEVASRLQQRTTAIMRYAVQSGLLDYNPAQEMVGAVASSNRQHRPALQLKRIPELLRRIDSYTGRPLTRLAVELTLLVFIRSSELRFARWSEIDFETSMWTIPAEREAIDGVKHSQRGSKMRTPHLVPLSHQALAILKDVYKLSGDRDFVF